LVASRPFTAVVKRLQIDRLVGADGDPDGRVRHHGLPQLRVDQFRDAVDILFGAAVDQQCHRRSLPLDHGVRARGRRIVEVLRLAQQANQVFLAVQAVRHSPQPVDETSGQIVRGRRRLRMHDAFTVRHTHVGERATVVDIDKDTHRDLRCLVA
jgi:hypothetical protein